MGLKDCCVSGCGVTLKSVPQRSFHRLPKDVALCRVWLKAINRVDLIGVEKLNGESRYRVCSDHFSEKQYGNTLQCPGKRLIKFAIPDILPGCSSQSADKELPTLQVPLEENFEECSTLIGSEESTVPETAIGTPEKRIITSMVTPKTRKIKNLRVRLSRERIRGRSLYKSASSSMDRQVLNHLKRFVSPALFEMVMNSFRRPFARKCNWSHDMKVKALNIYLQSPSTYRMLRKILKFPAKSTLLKMLKNYNVDVGFNKMVFELLGKVCEKMSDTEKLCCLTWDEMSVKPNFTYNNKDDVIDGFERIGEHVSDKAANQVLVFMVRGVRRNYKQVLGYFFANGATKSTFLVQLIQTAIEKLLDIGLNVVTTVCDQSATNRAAYKELGVTPEDPFFFVNHNRIYAFYDTPHLLKSTRNLFQKYVANFGNDCSAKWGYVVDVYNSDKDQPIRLTKLSDSHVNVRGFKKMNVRIAAQTLSHTVAGVMLSLQTYGHLPIEAGQTAEFIDNIDRAFDSLNGRTLKHSKALLRAVSVKSLHLSEWNKLISFFQSLSFHNSEGKRVNAPSVKGWLQNLHAAKLLWERVSGDGMHFLLMGRINQDCLENTFSVIRRKGGSRTNPSCNEFRYTFRAVFSQNMISCSEKSNCQPDCDEVLVNFKEHEPKNFVCTDKSMDVYSPGPQVRKIAYIDVQCGTVQNFSYENASHYIAGYLGKRVMKNNCKICEKELFDPQGALPEGVILPFFKEYVPERPALCYPSIALHDCVKKMINIFNENINDCKLHMNIGQEMCDIVFRNVDLSVFKDCYSDCSEFLVSVFVRLMLHASVKLWNSNLV